MRHQLPALLLLGAALTVSAPARTQGLRPAGWKDPTTAVLFGVIGPGFGQFYAGRPLKGAVVLGVFVGALAVGSAADKPDRCTAANLYLANLSCSGGNHTAGNIAVGVALADWIYGFVSASGDAKRHDRLLRTAAWRPCVAPASGDRMDIGASITLRR